MEIKNGKPKCLACNATVNFEYDLSVDNGYGGLTTCSVGTCPKCNQEYIWLEHYSYTGDSQLKKRVDNQQFV